MIANSYLANICHDFPSVWHGLELRLPVVVVVLRGDDDYHGEDGAQHNGGDANGQADEGEVACLAGGYFRRHHVPPGYRRTHLSDARREGTGVWERGEIRINVM